MCCLTIVLAGTEAAPAINHHLQQANIVLLLVSADFLASDACWDVEMKRALERHEARDAVVVPVLLRPCDWKAFPPLAKLEPLPADHVPVSRWTDREDAWVDIAQGLRRLIAAWPEAPPPR